MSTPVPTHTPDDASLRPLPLVHKLFGEPRFHTDGDVAAVAFAADGTLWFTEERTDRVDREHAQRPPRRALFQRADVLALHG